MSSLTLGADMARSSRTGGKTSESKARKASPATARLVFRCRGHMRRAGPFSGSPSVILRRIKSGKSAKHMGLTCHNGHARCPDGNGRSYSGKPRRHDATLACPRSLRVVGFLKAEVRQCDPQVRRQSKTPTALSHDWCYATRTGSASPAPAYAFQWLQKELTSPLRGIQ
jgi:hypothetical protein